MPRIPRSMHRRLPPATIFIEGVVHMIRPIAWYSWRLLVQLMAREERTLFLSLLLAAIIGDYSHSLCFWEHIEIRVQHL